jgi:hypothetical protein
LCTSPNKLSKKDFELRINTALEGNNLTSAKALVRKYGSTLNQDKGSLLIYGSKTKTGEMPLYA